jgi:hypothetical protein
MSDTDARKGDDLEFKTAAYFQSHGFFVRRGAMVSIAAGTADATDIDLLGLRFNLPLSEERLIADCKDRKRAKPFQRILWIRGLADFSKASRAVVVSPHAPWQAREFAAAGGIEVVDVEEIERYLRSTVAEVLPFGEASRELNVKLALARKKLPDEHRGLLREDSRTRNMLVSGHPLTNLNRLIRIISAAVVIAKSSTPEGSWFARYTYLNAVVTASLMMVRFAAECKWTPIRDWSDYARKKLTYGDVPPEKAKQLAQLALKEHFTDGLPAPEYMEEIVQAIEPLIAQPVVAGLIPYAVDFHLFGRVLGHLPPDYAPPVLREMEGSVMSMARRVVSVIGYAANVSTTFRDLTAARVADPGESTTAVDGPLVDPTSTSPKRAK